ncbi:MAG: hypothetical protein ACYC1D_12360 [Acidimicrobiales bacterium]
MAAGPEDEEVGYRLETWSAFGRSRLIERLIDAEIPHRFEAEELVVAAADEAEVDDLVEELGLLSEGEGEDDGGEPAALSEDGAPEVEVEAQEEAVALLFQAATRLREDPTDMQADANVAEASAVVFLVDEVPGVDPDGWAAVGRVTRGLLAALGADEALEGDIRREAAILAKLLAPAFGGNEPADALHEAAPDADEDADEDAVETAKGAAVRPERTVYELPEWLPEQRAELSLLLDGAGIEHTWDGGDLVVPASREGEVEGLFDRVEGVAVEEEDDEERYQNLAELFAASDRLAGDPADADRGEDLLLWIDAAEGPTPLGLDDAAWLRIRQRTRILADAIEQKAQTEVIGAEAGALRDQLRILM